MSLGKQAYKTADSALDLVISTARIEDCPTCGAARFKNGGIVKAADARKFRIVDEFAGKNRMNARRYSLEEVSA